MKRYLALFLVAFFVLPTLAFAQIEGDTTATDGETETVTTLDTAPEGEEGEGPAIDKTTTEEANTEAPAESDPILDTDRPAPHVNYTIVNDPSPVEDPADAALDAYNQPVQIDETAETAATRAAAAEKTDSTMLIWAGWLLVLVLIAGAGYLTYTKTKK